MGNLVAHEVHLLEPFGSREIPFKGIWQRYSGRFKVFQDLAEIYRSVVLRLWVWNLQVQLPQRPVEDLVRVKDLARFQRIFFSVPFTGRFPACWRKRCIIDMQLASYYY
jgi:hypothetical protein